MKEELGSWGAVVGMVVIATLFGGLTLAIYPGWKSVGQYLPALPQWSDLIAATSAIGTCAAVFVALWIAGKQNREDNRRSLEAAQLHAASLAGGLQETATYVRNIAVMLAFSDTQENRKRGLQSAATALQAPIKRPSTEALVALIPLPNRCAHRIARAYDLIEVAQSQAERYLRLDLGAKPFGDLVGHSDQRRSALMKASDLLTVANKECVSAAESGAPYPTSLEIFGEWHDDEY
jgi:hypothetical protein